MKKVLCDKDGKFISIHDEDCYLSELNDGDCLTHEDGTIIIYKESEGEPLFENMYFHAFYKDNVLHFSKNSASYYGCIGPKYRFSTAKEKELMKTVLSENGLTYSEERKCLEKKRWRANINNSYYHIDFGSLVVSQAMEEERTVDILRYNNLNYFQTKEEAEKKLSEIKSILAK